MHGYMRSEDKRKRPDEEGFAPKPHRTMIEIDNSKSRKDLTKCQSVIGRKVTEWQRFTYECMSACVCECASLCVCAVSELTVLREVTVCGAQR